MSISADSIDDYFRAVQACDVPAASDSVVGLLERGVPMDRIVTGVLAPAQIRTGQLWESGRWSVADEHAATSVTESALSALAYAATPRPAADARHVVVACAEGEWHSLPARMAAVVAAASGQVRVTMLGASLPSEQLHRRLSTGDVDVLALSCTMPTNLVGASRCIVAAHELGIPVIVGGSAFGTSSRRTDALGADAWADDARRILDATPELVGRHREIPTEALMLDAVDAATIAVAYDRMLAAHPPVADMTAYQQARTREDLVWVVRHTAAALLTDDSTIVEDALERWCARLHGVMPIGAVSATARLLAETLAPQAPAGAAMLVLAADRLENVTSQVDDQVSP